MNNRVTYPFFHIEWSPWYFWIYENLLNFFYSFEKNRNLEKIERIKKNRKYPTYGYTSLTINLKKSIPIKYVEKIFFCKIMSESYLKIKKN